MDSDNEDSYVANAERVAKQNFLREEVVDVGYESHLFVDYCDGLNGTDVDAWTFEELKECVRTFKRIYPTLEANYLATRQNPKLNVRQSLILPSEAIRDDQELIAIALNTVESDEEESPSFIQDPLSGAGRVQASVTKPVEQMCLVEASPLYEKAKVPPKSPVPSDPYLQRSYYEIPCKQQLPTDLSRAADASIEVAQ